MDNLIDAEQMMKYFVTSMPPVWSATLITSLTECKQTDSIIHPSATMAEIPIQSEVSKLMTGKDFNRLSF